MNVLKRIYEGIILKLSANTPTEDGSLHVDSADNKLKLRASGATHKVVTHDQTETLTNKTFDADGTGNSISNIENADIKAAAAIDATKIGDGTVTNAEFSYINALTSDAQTQLTNNATAISDHLSDTSDAHDASAISSIPSGNLAATEVQAALNELQSDIDTRALASGLSDHLSDTTDAHDASAISSIPSGNLAATEVQAALNELQSDIDTRALSSDLSNHLSDTVDAHDASAISSIPSGNLAATEVQAALNELQSDIDTRATSSALTTHTSASSAVHGITGSVVGTSDTQSLSNKTLSDALTVAQVSTPSTPASGFDKIYVKSDNKAYILDSTGAETKLGSGGVTGLIVDNNSIPSSSIGSWVAYADAAGVSPLDMTGGSPNSTIARNTTNPISDVADFLFTKNSGASRQGEGFSLTLTNIPLKYKSRGCIFRFKYLTSSTYVDNAVGLFIYDITGAVVYQLNPLYLKKSGLIESSFAEIQLPNTLTSGFRIGFHIIGTDTTAYTINFSEFTFDEKVTSQNSSITDWQSCTMTLTGTANYTMNGTKFRRVGDNAEFTGNILLTGAVSADLKLVLPSGFVLDTIKASQSGIGVSFGEAVGFKSPNYYSGLIVESNATSFAIVGPNTTLWGATVPFTWANNDNIAFRFSIPIAGWSAGTQVADIYTGRENLVHLVGSGSQAVTSGSGGNNITGLSKADTTRGVDLLDQWSDSTDIMTFKVSGNYKVFGTFDYYPTTAINNQAAYFLVRAVLNSTTIHQEYYKPTYVAANNRLNAPFSFTLKDVKVGDTLNFQIVNETGATLNFANTTDQTSITISKDSNPNQVLASEKVVEAWESNAGTSYTNAANLILEDKVLSTHGAYNPSTGEFIANKAGILTIDGVFSSFNTNTATEVSIYTRKNSVDHRMISDIHAPVASKSYIKYGDSFPVNQGDSIFTRVAHNGTSMATAAFTFYNHVTFTLES